MNVVSCNSPTRNQIAFGKKVATFVSYGLSVVSMLLYSISILKVYPSICVEVWHISVIWLQMSIPISLQGLLVIFLLFYHIVSSTDLINILKFLLETLWLLIQGVGFCGVWGVVFLGGCMCVLFVFFLNYLTLSSCFHLACSNCLFL